MMYCFLFNIIKMYENSFNSLLLILFKIIIKKMSKIMALSLLYFKPNLIKLINSNLLDYQLRNITKDLSSKIINKNKRTKKYFSKYINISSYISYNLINNIFLHYYSSSLTDCLFNFIKISSYNNYLPLSSVQSISLSKTIYLITKFIEPIILENIRKKNFGVIIIKGIKLSNVVLKLLYMLKDNFMYTDLIDYCFGIITINKGKSNENIDIYLSFILFFIVIFYKCYKRFEEIELKNENERKKRIKIINEKRKNEVIPPPNIEYYKLRNSNFVNLINKNRGVCLICSKIFNMPTAIKCCGGVFCYKCINNYLLLNKKCYLCLQYFDFGQKEIEKLLIKIYS